MWKNKYSIMLSRICVYLFMLAVLGGVVSGYWLINWFLDFSRSEIQGMFTQFAITAYSASVPVTITLFMLNKLLKNISNGDVFIRANVKCIRICSWCCIAVAIICGISSFYYFLFLPLAIMAGFMGLVLRVIKNIFDNAVILKEENDLTI